MDHFFCVSTPVLEALISRFIWAGAKSSVVPNACDTKTFQFEDIRQRKNLVIIYAGRIHPEKGLGILVDACEICGRRIPGLSLKMIGAWDIARGGGGSAYKKELEGHAKSFRLEFLGAECDPSSLAKKVKEGVIFCYPSIAENGESFGIAPLEAMATGSVVIVSDLACFKDFLKDGINGIVFHHKSLTAIRDLAEYLEKIIRNIDAFSKVSESASKEVNLTYSIEKVAKEYLNCFERILGV